METSSALLALCDGNPPVTSRFPSLFDVHLNKRWFETPSRSVWRHCNELILLGSSRRLSRRSANTPPWRRGWWPATIQWYKPGPRPSQSPPSAWAGSPNRPVSCGSRATACRLPRLKDGHIDGLAQDGGYSTISAERDLKDHLDVKDRFIWQ